MDANNSLGEKPPVRVFISYAWENDEYRKKVERLAARLREDYVDARLDAWHLEGLTIAEFMNREVRHADKVLFVCSPAYRSKVYAMEDGLSTGVGWESMLVSAKTFSAGLGRALVEVVLLQGTRDESVPLFLRGYPCLDLSEDDLFESNYRELLRRLTGHTKSAPPIGQLPADIDPEPVEPLRGNASNVFKDHADLSSDPSRSPRSKQHKMTGKAAIEPDREDPAMMFSPTISNYLADKKHFDRLHRGIQRLTDDQYRVVKSVNRMSRARFEGCAGSGKTLVASEIALRLSKAGSDVLFLCHNPQLASHIRTNLTVGSAVQVVDFCSWVRAIAKTEEPVSGSSWTHFDEPDDTTLDCAIRQVPKHGAIIVDEAQDFREKWWAVVEAGLKPDGFFYIFHDDHQSLLPAQGYPNLAGPLDLSRNCRNSQRVFDLMRCFDRTLPEAELSGGKVILRSYASGEEKKALTPILHEIFRQRLTENTVVLWAGIEPIDESPITDLEIAIPSGGHWRPEVIEQFERILNTYDSRGMIMPSEDVVASELASLSVEAYPTEDDIQRVQELASSFGIPEDIRRRIRNSAKFRDRFHWVQTADALRLHAPHTRRDPIWGAEIILKFQREDWHDGIPKPRMIRLRPYYKAGEDSSIPLYGVADFKGLEADVVILFARGRTIAHREMLYVGVSRARAMLFVLADESAARALPATFGWDDQLAN